MPRLLRPHIPISVRVEVATRQLGSATFEDRVFREDEESLGAFLARLLAALAKKLGCGVEDLRLDHDPALGAREKVFRKGRHVGYVPAANDRDHLIYRGKHAHHIKTNVRGDGAQHPDRVLIKKQRKLERRNEPTRGKKRASKPFASRPLRGANRWPPRGSRKFGR